MNVGFLSRAIVPCVALLLAGLGVLAGCTQSSSSDVSVDSTEARVSAAVSQTSSSPSAASSDGTDSDERSVADKLDDAVIETRVKQALMEHDNLRVFSFRPQVVNGRLSLRGDVNTPDQYREAERVTERVDGVSAVENELTMGGRPVTDERLSQGDAPAETTDAVYHTVRTGDTLWEIAQTYQASVDQIRRLNDLRSGHLRPGERIRIR